MGRDPVEDINNYFARVDDEQRPHETDNIRVDRAMLEPDDRLLETIDPLLLIVTGEHAYYWVNVIDQANSVTETVRRHLPIMPTGFNNLMVNFDDLSRWAIRIMYEE